MRAISENIDAENPERSAGFLTGTERKYLLGEWDPNDNGPGEYSDTQESRKRSEIRTRTRHALADIALLQEHGDGDLISSVIERDEDIRTFYPETLKHARNGLTAFTIHLAFEPERAESIVKTLNKTDWEGTIEEIAEADERSHEVAEEHSEPATQMANQLQQYADANGLSKEEVIDAIYLNWPE